MEDNKLDIGLAEEYESYMNMREKNVFKKKKETTSIYYLLSYGLITGLVTGFTVYFVMNLIRDFILGFLFGFIFGLICGYIVEKGNEKENN